jgi:hypothetical protein
MASGEVYKEHGCNAGLMSLWRTFGGLVIPLFIKQLTLPFETHYKSLERILAFCYNTFVLLISKERKNGS